MFAATPFISICIPAYKNVGYLKRLLDSIDLQNFRDFEVVMSDDSPDDAVRNLTATYENSFSITYIKHSPSLGTPENWNAAMKAAKGQWIKIMHDDDWFTDGDALKKFHQAIVAHPNIDFFFSAFRNVELEGGQSYEVRCSWWDLFILKRSPLHLFKKVYIGNPSCTMIRNKHIPLYDNRMKFVVDFEYYIRCIQSGMQWRYLDEVLLNIGFHSEQVTKYTFQVAAVQIPENHLLIRTMGAGILKNVIVFDYYWRMYRNLGLRTKEAVLALDPSPLHPIVSAMLYWQGKIPRGLLKIGMVSKLFMGTLYVLCLLHRNSFKDFPTSTSL